MSVLPKLTQRQVVVQITEHCNGSCPQCGMSIAHKTLRRVAELPVMTAVVHRAAELQAQAISFTGGEPFLHRPLLLYLLHEARTVGIRYTRTGTNGFLFTRRDDPAFEARMHGLAEGLTSAGLRNLWISLDSADPDVHERQRGLPGVVAGIEADLPVFAEHGLYPAANLAVNRHMGRRWLAPLAEVGEATFGAAAAQAAREFFARAIELGFTMANLCYPMDFPARHGNVDGPPGHDAPGRVVYAATSGDASVSFTVTERAVLYRALATVVAEMRPRIRIFTPQSSLEALARENEQEAETGDRRRGRDSFACRGGRDYFFVDVNGVAYPCGFRGDEPLGPFRLLDRARIGVDTDCRACDWECFRDPSQLFGQAYALHRPLVALAHRRRDELFPLWLKDVRYALACRLFDGRRPLEPQRLRRACREPVAGGLPDPALTGGVRTDEATGATLGGESRLAVSRFAWSDRARDSGHADRREVAGTDG